MVRKDLSPAARARIMEINRYEDAKEYLESLIPDPEEKRRGNMRLERIEHLLKFLGNPQKKYKTIHVGGTSGKGLTAFFISSILKEAGYKVGLHISPHLQVITERMQVNGRFIDEKTFCQMVEEITPLVDEVEKKGDFGKPSYFEVLVALSFQYFEKEKIDVAVIEVGLGGTFDATNVIHPLVSVITDVSLDHTEILGDTVEKIASDKAGIIKEGIDVVTGATQESVLKIIESRCEERGARLTSITPEGTFQEQDFLLALEAVKTLKKHGFSIDERAAQDIFKKVKFAGRMEIVQGNPLVILDGAHNPAKMKAFVFALKKQFPCTQFTTAVAFKKGKAIEAMIQELLPVTKEFIITAFLTGTDSGFNMATSPEDIAHIIKSVDPSKPFRIERELILPSEPTLITGSLYLVGEIRNRWYPWGNVLKNRNWY